MAEKKLGRYKEQTESGVAKGKELDNAKRILTMLEKALERILRRNYFNRNQYPPIAFEIEEQINILRRWIEDYQLYCALPSFHLQVGLAMKELESKVGQLLAMSKPSAGKKGIKKTADSVSILNLVNQ